MCNPVALTIASGLMGAYGSVQQGDAQAAAYGAQAEAARQNAKIAEDQMADTLARGAREEHTLRQQGAQFTSTQGSMLAASGVQMSGSSLSVLQDTGMGIEQDADTLRLNFSKERWGHEVERTNFLNEASAASAAASNAKRAGKIGALTSLLGTAASVYGMSTSAPTKSVVENGNITVGGGVQVPTPFGTMTYTPEGGFLPMYDAPFNDVSKAGAEVSKALGKTKRRR